MLKLHIANALCLGLGLGTSLAARAHEGHGLPGSSHWHAGDSLLWLGAAGAAVLLWLAIRRR